METCNVCRTAKVSHVCRRCHVATYCSKQCQKRAWNTIHSKACGFLPFLIEGKRGRQEDDREAEEEYLKKLEQYEAQPSEALLEQLEMLYGSLSEQQQERFAERHPCHNQDDPISYDALNELTDDNKVYLFSGGIKYCFSVDSLWRYVRDKRPFDPRSREDVVDIYRNRLSDVQIIYIREAVDKRISTELNRIYRYELNFEASIYNLTHTYNYYEFDFSRIDPNRIGNSGYVADLFENFKRLAEVIEEFPIYEQYVTTYKSFWRDLLRRLDAQHIRGNEMDEELEERGRHLIAPFVHVYYILNFKGEDYHIYPENPRNIDSVINAYDEKLDEFNWYDAEGYLISDEWVVYAWIANGEGDYETSTSGGFDLRKLREDIGQYINEGLEGVFTLEAGYQYEPPYINIKVQDSDENELASVEDINGNYFSWGNDNDNRYSLSEIIRAVENSNVATVRIEIEQETNTIHGVENLERDLREEIWEYISDGQHYGPWIGGDSTCNVIITLIH